MTPPLCAAWHREPGHRHRPDQPRGRAAGPHPLLLGGPADVLPYTQCALDDRLVIRGLHAEAATLTHDLDAVRTYQAAMDITATLALPPTTRITAP
ncbi:hypothetical protein ACIOGT_37400 [Streptomyces microflavus]|uniref:hypothetical protein n=1 Tax=Streptomyces microflavus TaxID=1919 RepID=UPI0037F9B886